MTTSRRRQRVHEDALVTLNVAAALLLSMTVLVLSTLPRAAEAAALLVQQGRATTSAARPLRGPSTAMSNRRRRPFLRSTNNSAGRCLHYARDQEVDEDNGGGLGRRNAISKMGWSVATLASLSPAPQAASAAEKKPSIVPGAEVARRLRRVPTFALVDGNGTPFHTYDKDSASGAGYFFLSYDGAQVVLDDARKAFAEAKTKAKDGAADDVPDAWGDARIVTVPLDYAMQLTLKKPKSKAQNGEMYQTFYQIIPAADDLTAALRVEYSERYKQRGRVPLFYADGLRLPPAEEGGDPLTPAYFHPTDLLAEWKRQYPEMALPKAQVRELSETFREMILPGGRDDSVRNLVLVPTDDSVRAARECARAQEGSGPAYRLGEMILTR